MRVYQESERKYDVDPAFAVPELDDLPGVTTVSAPEVFHLEATYFDTADLRLLGAGITLRRRTGGADAGWHLKRPAATNGFKPDTRTEFQHPLGRATRTVPAPLAELVRVHSRGQKLIPVARIVTTRRAHQLLDAEGNRLAELSDDDVSAQRLHGPNGQSVELTAWREVEVELDAGDPELLDAVAARLRLAGAQPASASSKLARVLTTAAANSAADAASAGQGSATKGAGSMRRSSAGAVVLDAVRHQVEALTHWDPQVRRDQPDAVHQMRVTCRRLRSILSGYRLVLDRSVTDPIRAELKWLAGELGVARDTEVMHQRLRHLVDGQADELVLGPVLARIDTTLTTRYQEAHQKVLAALDDRRYLRLLDALDALVAEPPFTDAASRKATKTLPKSVRHAWKRLARRAEAVEAADREGRRDLLLHEVRKGAKQARYVAEVAEAVHGKPAKRFTNATKRVQQALGDHQDTVVTRQELRELGVRAHLAGENGFTFGLLYGVEQADAADSDTAYTAAWAKATRPKLHRWLK